MILYSEQRNRTILQFKASCSQNFYMSFSRSTTYWQPFYIGSIFWPTMYASLNIVEEEIFLENDDDLQLNAAMKSYC